MRARDDADLSGAILNPLCDQNLSSYETRIDLSLFLSSLKGFKARGRGTRERDERGLFRRDRFRLSTVSLNAFLQISFPIKSSSRSNESERISLSREREKMSRVRCKIPDTKSTPKRLHANKKTKRERHYRTVCASENILLCISFSLRALKCVCL